MTLYNKSKHLKFIEKSICPIIGKTFREVAQNIYATAINFGNSNLEYIYIPYQELLDIKNKENALMVKACINDVNEIRFYSIERQENETENQYYMRLTTLYKHVANKHRESISQILRNDKEHIYLFGSGNEIFIMNNHDEDDV